MMNKRMFAALLLTSLSLTSVLSVVAIERTANSPSTNAPSEPIIDPPSPFTAFQYDYPQVLIASALDNVTVMTSTVLVPTTVNSEIRVWGNLLLRNNTASYTILEEDIIYTSVNGLSVKAPICIATTPNVIQVRCFPLLFLATGNSPVQIITTGSYKGAYLISYMFETVASSVNPYGQLTPTPALVTTPITNNFGGPIEVYVTTTSTPTAVSKNGVVIFSATSPPKGTITVILHVGETIQVSQIVGVTWTWWRM